MVDDSMQRVYKIAEVAMGKRLTKEELHKIEESINEISARSEFLDPSNPFESVILLNDDNALSSYISILENSYRSARVKESPLRVVSASVS